MEVFKNGVSIWYEPLTDDNFANRNQLLTGKLLEIAGVGAVKTGNFEFVTPDGRTYTGYIVD